MAGGLNKNQQAIFFSGLSPTLLPRGAKKPRRMNASLLREMWRTAASLELLPVQTKTQLGEASAGAGEVRAICAKRRLWCLSRIGARKLFYGPINQVLPASTATRWIEALVKVPGSADALVAIAQAYRRCARAMFQRATLELVRRSVPAGMVPALEGEQGEDFGKIFGEELPSGLVAAVW